MNIEPLQAAIATIPAGPWAVGVSGGADSVALLSLLRERTDLQLHVVHLNHETRGSDSIADAEFVTQLAGDWNLPCTIALRSEIESTLVAPTTNPSARYRAARIALFTRVVAENRLSGVILAHHADDQAETVMQRLLRGSGPAGLAGMRDVSHIGPLRIVRPLLRIRRQALRDHLTRNGRSWREDASNADDVYLRNRIRRILQASLDLTEAMLRLADACAALRVWSDANAPELGETFDVNQLSDLPELLRRTAATCWLIARGVPPEGITPNVVSRFISMARDAATPARSHFPGRISVHRRRGTIGAKCIE